MGVAKEQMMKKEDDLRKAGVYLVEAGACKECEAHETLISCGDEDAVRTAIKNAKKAGESAEFVSAIRQAYEEAAMQCERCTKNMAD
jgi:uncharacterized protein YqeY